MLLCGGAEDGARTLHVSGRPWILDRPGSLGPLHPRVMQAKAGAPPARRLLRAHTHELVLQANAACGPKGAFGTIISLSQDAPAMMGA